jgi:hypothetical protein
MGDYIPEYTYTVTDGKATITGYIGPGGAAKIPSTLGGFPVTSIGNHSFRDNVNITSITIPNWVQTIGGFAFYQSSLQSITIEANTIGRFAFGYCGSLTSVTLESSIILEYAFFMCTSLNSVTMGNGVTYIDRYVFRECDSLTSITIGESVTTIGSGAFVLCTSLTSVTISKSVTTIATSVFSGCSALTSINVHPDNPNFTSLSGVLYNKDTTVLIQYPIGLTGPFVVPDSVITIGGQAFSGCSGLSSITFGSKVTTISIGAFGYCTGLTSLTIPDSVTHIGVNAFFYATSIASLTLGNNLTVIGSGAFYHCSALTSVVIPNSVTIIDVSAFWLCTSMTSITIGSGVTSIKDNVFNQCTSLTDMTFLGLKAPSIGPSWLSGANPGVRGHAYYSSNFPPQGSSFYGLIMGDYIPEYTYTVTSGKATITGYIGPGGAAKMPPTLGGFPVVSIGPSSFQNNANITSILIPDSVTSIGSFAFFRCSALTSVTIGNGVTSIGDLAFADLYALTSVTIGSGVTSIGTESFRYCTSLISITIPDSVASIGFAAFSGCSAMTSVTIGSGVTFIDVGVFYYCSALTQINVDSDNLIYASVNGVLYSKDLTTLIQYPIGLSGPFAIPNGVVNIGNDAFRSCAGLTSITIPNSVTTIGFCAFSECSSLASVTMGAGITTIHDSAFASCLALTSIALPDSVTNIGWDVFAYCYGLTSVTFGSGLTTIGGEVFYESYSLSSIYFRGLTAPTSVDEYWLWHVPSSVRGHAYYSSNFPLQGGSFHGLIMGDYIPEYTYTVTDGKATITGYIGPGGAAKIPPTLGGFPVTAIGPSAFVGNTKITSLIIADSVTTIGDSAFERCTSLNSVIIPGSVTTMGTYVFEHCSALTSVTIGYGVTTINDDDFAYCRALTSITIPNSVNYIGIRAFYYCSALTTIDIPDSVTSIGYLAFEHCTAMVAINVDPSNPNYASIDGVLYNDTITALIDCPEALSGSLSIPEGVLEIRTYAFSQSALTSVIIPDSVSSMGAYTFYYCSVLTSVTIGNGVTSVGNYAFYSCSALTSVVIGSKVTTIGYQAFYHCVNLTAVTIPYGVITIGDHAFERCTSLTSINIPSTVTSIGGMAFSECYALTSVTIPDSVTSISSYAFHGCISLTSITIPDSVTYLGSCAFLRCRNLTSVTIGSGVTAIDYGTFRYCTSLTSINFRALNAPTSVDLNWISTNSTMRGHAYYASNFPAPGSSFYGLIMGAYIPEGYTYTVYEGNATITGYLGAGGDITIPTTLGGCPVIAIGDSAFLNNANITDLTIPSSVRTIGYLAFANSDMISVNIDSGVSSIGPYAFAYCYELASINIPESVTSIGTRAFRECTSLTSITIPNSVTFIGIYAFMQCTSLTSVIIGNGVTTISDFTFIECTSLDSVLIGNSVTTIGVLAFGDCTSLTSITIPEGVTTIGSFAFASCFSLTTINVDADNPNYASVDGVLYSKDLTELVQYPAGLSGPFVIPNSVTTIGDQAFYGSPGLSSITIPNSVTTIGVYAFQYCEALTSVTIPSSVNMIGTWAFGCCYNLTSVIFHGLTAPIVGSDWANRSSSSILGHAYYASNFPAPGGDFFGLVMGAYIPEGYTYTVTDGNATITGYLGEGGDITIPTTLGGCPVIAIGDHAFLNNANITNLTIPSSVQTIGIGAFSNCVNMTMIKIGSGVISIGERAFDGASTLTKISVDVMNPVYTSRGYVFLEYIHRWQKVDLGCLYDKELTTLIRCPEGIPFLLIPGYDDVVTTILDGACRGCKFITSVYLPWSINSIGDQAFYGCTGLISVEMLYHVTSIGEQAFAGCSNLTTVHIGDSVTSIGEGAFMGCGHLTDIWMPNGITSIQPNLFQACSSLTSIIIPVGVTTIGDSAFSDCTSLTSITFLGLKTPTTGSGWIAGTSATLRGHAYQGSEFPITGSDFDGLTMGSYIPYDYTFTFDGSQVTITGYTGTGGTITMPSEIGGYPVTIIGDRSFQNNGNIVHLTIPSSVNIIGEWAFDHTSALETLTIVGSGSTSIGLCAFQNSNVVSVTIGSGVISIGERAFAICERLASITIAEGLERIESMAFYASTLPYIDLPSTVVCISSSVDDYRAMGAFFYCDELTAINVDEDNPVFASLDGVLYDKAMSKLLLYPSGRPDASFTVPNTVNTLDNYSFFNSRYLVSITIPGNVNTINSSAFSEGHALASVIIENGLTSIGDRAFDVCYELDSVSLPESLTSIGDNAFWGDRSLASIEFPEGLISIGVLAFCGCGLISVDIPDSVTTIGGSAFSNCDQLTSVIIGRGVTSMDGAFSSCFAITYFDVDEDNLNYASVDGVLYNEAMTTLLQYPSAKAGSSFVMPDTVTAIGTRAFNKCLNLVSVLLSNNLADIAGRAFSNCPNIASLTIPGSVTHIGLFAFSGCSSLTTVNFLGLTDPVGDVVGDVTYLYLGTPAGALGHAYYASDFPPPGQTFGGLLMGSYLSDVTFSQTGVDTSNAGIILTVDGTSYQAAQLPITFTWYSGSEHSFAWSQTVSIDPVTRFNWQSSSGLCADLFGTLTVPDMCGSISAVYTTQHWASFVATGLDGDAGTNTVLTVGTTTYAWNDIPGDIWVDDGTAFFWSSPVPAGGDRVFTLLQHSGLASPIVTSGTETADYFKSLTISGHVYITGTTTGAPDWHMQLWKDGSQVGPDDVTDASGAYSLTVTLPGTYQVREVLKDGWTETSPILTYSTGDGPTPSVLGYADITVTSGIDVNGLDFENFEWVVVSGTKFFDANGNGLREADEPCLQNWAMSIERDGAPYPGPTLTDTDGRYEFIVKDPGRYIVTESAKYLWVQTCPFDGTYSFPAMSGQDEADLDFGNWLGGQARVTTSDLSMFDMDGNVENGRQFKLLFTPDVPDFPTLFTLTASNPGQFYFNTFFLGSVSKGDTFVLSIPFPFVTQGTEPIHVYSGLNTDPLGWLVPGADISSLFGFSATTISWSYDGQNGSSDRAVITLTALDDYAGFLYINLHLDYGLKKNIGGLSPGGSNDAVGAVLTIEDGWQYTFSVTGPEGFSDEDEVMNVNAFKRSPGFGGLVLDEDGDPVVGAVIEIWLKNDLIGTVITDDDGWYMLDYKHTGKPTTFTLKLFIDDELITEITVTVKPASFSMVIFDLSTPPSEPPPEPPPEEEPPVKPPKPPKK